MIPYTYTHQGAGTNVLLKITPWYRGSQTPPFDDITNIILNDIFEYTTKYQVSKIPKYNIITEKIIIDLLNHATITIEISNKNIIIKSTYFTKTISLLSYTTITDYI